MIVAVGVDSMGDAVADAIVAIFSAVSGVDPAGGVGVLIAKDAVAEGVGGWVPAMTGSVASASVPDELHPVRARAKNTKNN